MNIPRTYVFYDLMINIRYSNDDFIHKAAPFDSDSETNDSTHVTLVSSPTSHPPTQKGSQYHGSIHPRDACLIRALVGQGLHIIGAVKRDSRRITPGHFTPLGADRHEGNTIPPIPMQFLTAKLRWSILA